ncbi:putative gastrointestinal growth factor xP1 [Eublepharis macularius]|uniref:Gastrointestinal growth factor xP1 n=1 Tax=Eublepharis macularius TaxID=481883 RepID=A0AA97J4B2_EUBMA|nr:putative gastrointestinal growth factor xP1 [Eublepharis macularius]
MEHKRFLLWAVVLILGLSSSLTNGNTILSSQQCEIQPIARVNCGYAGISAEECNNRGCCFDSRITGVIWCFFPKNGPECF